MKIRQNLVTILHPFDLPSFKKGTIFDSPFFVTEFRARIGLPHPSSAKAAPRKKSIWPPTPEKMLNVVRLLKNAEGIRKLIKTHEQNQSNHAQRVYMVLFIITCIFY